jgi:hypothetical protein
MKVSQAGRLRVIKEKRKNVHAGIIGEWTNDLMVIAKYIGYSHKGKTITYNPYIHTSFVEKETGNRVYSANCVTLNGRTVTAYN